MSKLGVGAYGTVWLALDQSTRYDGSGCSRVVLSVRRQHVAVKVVNNPKFFSAAVYESTVCKDLEHPHIVRTMAWHAAVLLWMMGCDGFAASRRRRRA